MRWEELTSSEFSQAAQEAGICVVAMGVVEKHGEHLPLGTDYLNGHSIAAMAAEKEPAIVFPPFYFGQIYEAQCFPGTLAVKPRLLLELIEDVFDEISRNGIKKILIYNAHGGNTFLVKFLAQLNLAGDRDYTLYIPTIRLTEKRKKEWDSILDAAWGGHGHEAETSVSLANHPDIVKMDRVQDQPGGAPLNRLDHLPDIYTGITWYSDYPDHYSGDACKATQEKGEKLRQLLVDTLAEQVRAVKQDTVAPELIKEFRSKRNH